MYSTLTCPKCGHKQKEKMPEAGCQAFYKCGGCKKLISAGKSCCVFCDYGDKPCPISREHKTNL